MRLVGYPEALLPYDWQAIRARVDCAHAMVAEDRLDEAEFIVRGARRVIERYEHRSARWGVMTLDLAWFRCLARDWEGCLRFARQAASSLLASGRASGGLPYAQACMFIGRSYVELGEEGRAVRFLEVASAAGQAWGDDGGWIADEADIGLGTALARLRRWADARRPLERAWRLMTDEAFPQAAQRRTGRFYATALYRTGRLDDAWNVIRVCILDLSDESAWRLAMDVIGAIDERGDGERAMWLWCAMEDDYITGAGSKRPGPVAGSGQMMPVPYGLPRPMPCVPTCA